jgi:anaerobic selenocysteine-containing dehydrogenase
MLPPMEIRTSACPLDCPDLCSLDVTVEETQAGTRVTKMNGSHRSPVTNGFICSKVRNLADHLYGADRLQHPMIRNGAKGSGAYRQASWEEALDLITARFTALIAQHGAESILPYHYGGSNGWLTEGGLASRFFRRLGASRLERTLCAAATTVATRGLYGVMPGVAMEDIEHAKLIVIWGSNPSATSIHLVPIIERAIAAGAKLVVVDPRRTPLAKRADVHVALRPGTDLPVALAMIRALFKNGADRRFLHDHCDQSDELAARAEPWTLAAAARVAEVDTDTLQSFYQLYCDTNPAVIRVGWGPERNRNGGSAIAAILAMPAVAGKFGKRGSGFVMSNGDARWGMSAEAGIATPAPDTQLVNMSEIARVLRDGPRAGGAAIKSLFVYNCNPVATALNQQELITQLSRDDIFMVVHEQVMTDTAALADVILPATAFVEHREMRRGYGTMRLYDSAPVASPVGESRSNNQLFADLLTRFDLVKSGDPMTDQELVDTILASAPQGEQMRSELTRDGVASPPDGPRPIMFVDSFPSTSNGRVQLLPNALDAATPNGLYRYQADPGSDEFPLALISPALATQISSMFGQLRTKPAVVEISLVDAKARDIKDGSRCRIWNQLGEVICQAQISRDLKPGVALLAKGYWRKHTSNGLTSNALIPEAFADLGGQAAFNDARVQIARIGS